jgi:hypothetical protein
MFGGRTVSGHEPFHISLINEAIPKASIRAGFQRTSNGKRDTNDYARRSVAAQMCQNRPWFRCLSPPRPTAPVTRHCQAAR